MTVCVYIPYNQKDAPTYSIMSLVFMIRALHVCKRALCIHTEAPRGISNALHVILAMIRTNLQSYEPYVS